jgi:hypothetical protein
MLAAAQKEENAFKSAVDAFGTPIAEAFGEMLGAPPGLSSTILHGGVELVDQLFPEVFSSGPKERDNVAQASQTTGMVPAAYTDMFEKGDAEVRTHVDAGDMVTTVRHAELVADLLSTAGEQVIGLDINPGLETSFPWLSGIANEFQSYKLRDLKYLYNPQEGTDTNGAIVAGVLADSSADLPSQDRDIASLDRGIAAGLNRPLCVDVADAQLNVIGPNKFVRSTNTTNAERRTSDSGKLVFKLNSAAVPVTEPVGYLMTSYEVELRHPVGQDQQTSTTTETLIADGTIGIANGATWTFFNVGTVASPLYQSIPVQSPYGVKMNAAGALKFPRGWWKCKFTIDSHMTSYGACSIFAAGFTIGYNGNFVAGIELITYGDLGPVEALGVPVAALGRSLASTSEFSGEYSDVVDTAGAYPVRHTWTVPYWSDGDTSVMIPQFTFKAGMVGTNTSLRNQILEVSPM